MPTPDRETRSLITSARILGTGGLSVRLTDDELLRLCAIMAGDVGRPELVREIAAPAEVSKGYYGTPMEWFRNPLSGSVDLADIFLVLDQEIEDFRTYFRQLCELHKRRLKFHGILQAQPLARMEQVVPRCLLEYGLRPAETLASWLVWRKWLYDIDNRSAQETGYLFEPILAAALGGVPYSARTSPIKRTDDKTKGRQVDCIDGDLAYEFKMRVTIAASGQGRFKEELDFARDCHESGYKPVLLVLDPTMSERLADLQREFSKYDGRSYTGEEAWTYLEQKSGSVMGTFVEKYVRIPLREVETAYVGPLPISLVSSGDEIRVRLGDQSFSIHRSLSGEVDAALLALDSSEEDEGQR